MVEFNTMSSGRRNKEREKHTYLASVRKYVGLDCPAEKFNQSTTHA